MNYTSRSEVLKWQACPRKRYWSTVFNRRGIQPRTRSVPLAVGIAVHEGVEGLLRGKSVDYCATLGVASFLRYVEDRKLAGIPDEQRNFALGENLAMVEALVRVYGLVQLPRLLTEYDVVAVERELDAPLGHDLTFLGRTDGELLRKMDGKLGVFSLKTTSTWGPWSERAARLDMQGKSETWLTQAATGVRPEFVKMDFLVKGKYESYGLMFGGAKFYNSFLLHPYKKVGLSFTSSGLAPQYEFPNGKGGKTRLGKEWKRCAIWQEGEIGVGAWIEQIFAGEFFGADHLNGRDLLAQWIHTPIPYFRTDGEIKAWQIQTAEAEAEIIRKSQMIHELGLDATFPQHTAACFDYNTPCEFYGICWDGADPADERLWEPRRYNHPKEGENHGM